MANERKIQVVFQKGTDDAAWERYLEILGQAKRRAIERNELKLASNDAEVIRRLIGLEPPDWFLTKEDISYFQSRKKATGRASIGKAVDEPAAAGGKKANGGTKR